MVLLHGQPGRGTEFGRVIDALAPTVDAVAPDRPGYGDNPLPAGGVGANVDWLAGLVDTGRGSGAPLVVAHSWAGGVALALALHHPDLVRGLVLIGSVGPGAVSRMDRVLAVPAGALAAARATSGTAPRRRARRRAVVAAFLAEQVALVRELPLLLSQLDRIATPTTVIGGGRDRVVPPATALSLVAALPRAELVSVPDGGHRLHRTHPELVAGVIGRALAGSGPR